MRFLYDEADDAPTKIGKVIGSVLAGLAFLGIVALLANHVILH
jgi:hypothetical protein